MRGHGRKTAARRLNVVATTVALALLVCACGSDVSPSTSPSGDSALAGHWRVSGEAAVYVAGGRDFFIAVDGQDGEYLLGVDGQPPRPATVSGGRIVLPFQSCTGTAAEFGLDGSRPAVFALVNPVQSPGTGEPSGPTWQSFATEELTAEDYAAATVAKVAETMRIELGSLKILISTWARDSGGLPGVADMNEESAFGDWATGLGVWPVNPYTGEPMQPGTAAGEFTYAVSGGEFTLIGHLHDGTSFSLESE